MSENIPLDLELAWNTLQDAWREAFDVWVVGGDTAPVADIAERTVRRLWDNELEALIRHLSTKLADSFYVRVIAGYVDFWELWIMSAISEQGRRIHVAKQVDPEPLDSPENPPDCDPST